MKKLLVLLALVANVAHADGGDPFDHPMFRSQVASDKEFAAMNRRLNEPMETAAPAQPAVKAESRVSRVEVKTLPAMAAEPAPTTEIVTSNPEALAAIERAAKRARENGEELVHSKTVVH